MPTEKKIEDYLPFYIGCDVQFIDDQNKVQSYGEFEYAVITGIFQCPSGAGLTAQLMVDDWEEPLDVLVSDIKPLFRQLSDITEEEKNKFIEVCGLEPEDIGCLVKTRDDFFPQPEMSFGTAHLTNIAQWAIGVKYLLSLQMDLFDLIHSGLAIDKSKTK